MMLRVTLLHKDTFIAHHMMTFQLVNLCNYGGILTLCDSLERGNSIKALTDINCLLNYTL